MLGFLETVAVQIKCLPMYWALAASGLDVGNILNDVKEGKSSSTATSNLESNISTLGSGAWRIVFMSMTFLFVLGLAYAFAKLFFSNSQTRNESKSDIIWKVLAVIGAFAVVGLVIILSGVGKGLFTP